MAIRVRVAVLAIVVPLAIPALLSGQARRPSMPARRPLPSSTGQRVRPPSPFAGVSSVRPLGHRPLPCRSSILGLVLFDPYWWSSSDATDVDTWVASAGERASRPLGGLQLDVDPRRALVYVDGLFAGTVDDYAGYFHHLDATAGTHIIEMVAPDYEPLIIEVLVSPGRTTTYRGNLNRAPGRE